MSMPKKANNKKMILIFAAVFILPVILAKLALENGWFNEASTNKGILIQPALDMSLIKSANQDPKWKLVYVLPEFCDVSCENALYSIKQVWSALGKESDRAEAVVISHEKSHQLQLQRISKESHVRIINTDLSNIKQVFKNNDVDGIFIADTLNNVILRYPLQQDAEQAVLHSRDILSDMRKVLKLSRIG
ncbi:hypothetical protein RS130_04315 [Paraglaciecola aquimarina]|uniref:Uncharacterized protein n=1 Tax=Paraglaciecola aquimarina TaxID=1235557 RepID=A0ABU3STB7_9ALTE|nr:hypothetical protein [Paraglaciecola aquimarina]MDU0353255.1 hypothetical protein [Paraglaciecola aquimarina]